MSGLETFGKGHMDLEGIDLQHTTSLKKAEYFGTRVGCPKVPSLVEERGADEMAHRYAEMLLYFPLLLDEVKKVRPDIASHIEGPLDRLPDEPLAVFDKDWIPAENLTQIPGPETPLGYSLPRLVTSYIWESKTEGDAAARMSRVLTFFDETLKGLDKKDGANALLLKFAETLTTEGKANPRLILRRTISQGKMEQDSFYTYFREIVGDMEKYAPTLSATYKSLNPQDKKGLGIANPFGI